MLLFVKKMGGCFGKESKVLVDLGCYVRIDELKMGMEIVSLDVQTRKLVKD